MRHFLAALLLAACHALYAAAYMIEVQAGKKECFFEDLHVKDKMTVTYQLAHGGHLDIDFWLADPAGVALTKQLKQSTGTASITAEKDGRYEYCFSNEMSTVTDKLVSFNVHGVIYMSDARKSPSTRDSRPRKRSQGVKDEQEYIKVREKTHRNTAESTNDRVKWWSIAQAVVVVGVVGWQVWFIQSFFETKRVI
ncbi:supernatant protein factor, C-terminal domain-containing protein [Auriculariales sp. MPI-PUGE-AT-0066]|nr:supernatant protein factor, C-terminal domain-containing protein [Auriculariales sp. MPI-PUGE-AT-0066]